MMAGKKFLYGLVIGAILGFIFSCMRSTQTTYFPWGPLIIATTICSVAGLIWGSVQDQAEEKRRAAERWRNEMAQKQLEAQRIEEKKRAEEEYRFQDWSDRIHSQFKKIEKEISPGYSPENAYDAIWTLRDQTAGEPRYQGEYQRQYQEHCRFLRRELRKFLRREMGIGGLAAAVSAVECLVKAEPDVKTNVQAMEALRETLAVSLEPLCFISFSGYGECDFLMDQPGAMEVAASKAERLLLKFKEAEHAICKGNGDIITQIIQYINADFILDQCMLMWYFANLKPFDVNGFESARMAFLTHTALYCEDTGIKDHIKAYAFGGEDFRIVALGKVEEVLARIYSKNQIGGAGTVRQEKDYIDFWLAQRINSEDFEDCYALASGLAWMELYELELDVLRKLVSSDVQLPTELQERLSFLESGGMTNIKLYEVADSAEFLFDNSSGEWKTTDFAVLFRKMSMKKKRINYSMLITKWTKTLPLSSGQKVSEEYINEMLKQMVEDFDDEITFQLVDASAVNMANVRYKNAALFHFVKERTRCVSVLFSHEKFGRNLNLTMLTLFTPDRELSFEQLEKYCMAVKDNVYIESFRESILQVVDEAIKMKQSVYDEGMPKEKLFVE